MLRKISFILLAVALYTITSMRSFQEEYSSDRNGVFLIYYKNEISYKQVKNLADNNGRLIVCFSKDYTKTQINKIMSEYKHPIINKMNGINMIVIKVPDGQENDVIKILGKDKRIEFCSKNYLLSVE